MANQVGTIPEFTKDDTASQEVVEETGSEQVKQTPTEEVVEGKDTPSEPAADTEPTAESGEDTGGFNKSQLDLAVERATQGLRSEIVELRTKLNDPNRTDRKIVQQELVVAEQKLDDLSDVNPEDVALIEKVL